MDTASVIGNMFATFTNQLVNPVTDGLWGILPKVIGLALIIAVVGVIFAPSMKRGAKVGTIIVVILIAFSIQFIPALVYSLTGDIGSVTSAATNAVSSTSSLATTPPAGLNS